MNTPTPTKRPPTAALLALGLAVCVGWPAASAAVEPEFVGVLAIAVEDDVARQLQLTDQQKNSLTKLIAEREDDEELTELVMQTKDLPPAEREKVLAPYRRESEQMGLKLLSPEQQTLLMAIAARRSGVAPPSPAEQPPEQPAEQPAEPATQPSVEPAEEPAPEPSDERPLEPPEEPGVKPTDQPGVEPPEEPGVKPTAEPGLKPPDEPGVKPPEEPGVEPTEEPGVEPPEEPGVETPEQPGLKAPGEAPTEPAEEPPLEPPEQPGLEPAEEPPSEPAEQPAEEPPKRAEKLRFNFRYQPWKDVLDWFAKQADLSLVLDAAPPGTFNYTDDREYTPAEAIDLINSVLLTKGYTLVRRERMLMLINLEDGIPPNLVSTIPVEELDQRGEFELVSVLFQLERLTPEEVEEEIKKLIGPQGSVVPLPKSKQVLVTETAGRLRAIREVIQRIEYPEGPPDGEMKAFPMEFALPEEVLTIMRQLLDIPEDGNATADGSLRLALDPAGDRLLATGKRDKLARVEEILKAIDVPGPGQLNAEYVKEDPQLEVYSITTADPAASLAVMQTLLAGLPGVRLATDPKTGNLVALARPSEHKTIKATLDQLQRDARQVEVIRLYTVDPQLAVLTINKLFGAGEEETQASAPQVDADPTTGQLLIRGTQGQIAQIRTLLEKMGESDSMAERAAGGGTVRVVPLRGQAARSALDRIQEIWPTMRRNKIRVVTPSASIPTITPGSPVVAPGWERPQPELPKPAPKPPSPPSLDAEPAAADNRSARLPFGAWVWLAAETTEEGEPPADESQPPESPPGPAAAVPQDTKEPPPIIVAPGPGGLMIASSDVEALDEFEQLLNTLAGNVLAGGPELTIFYLKHVKASVAAETLDHIFGGGTLAEASSGGGLIGDLAGAALGEAGGGILGSLLGLGGEGGTIAASGSIRITPDSRLNALVVQANPTDLAMIEQLLKILDQKEPPEEVLAVPKARVIRIINFQAEEIAEILNEVYQDRLVTGSRGGQGGQRPSPEEFIRMLRGGGRGGRGGSSRGGTEELQKMSLSIDTRTNSLIVAAPEPLLNEVEQLVRQLDQAAVESTNQKTVVVTLHRASPAAVQQAISAFAGESAQFGRRAAGRPTTPSQPPSSSRPSPRPTPPSSPPTSYRPPMMMPFRAPSSSSPQSAPRPTVRRPTRR